MLNINEESLEALFPKIRRIIEMVDLSVNNISREYRSSVITSAISYLSQLISLVIPNSVSSVPNSNRIKFKWFKEEYQLDLEVIPNRSRSAFYISKKSKVKSIMWLVDNDQQVFETILTFLLTPYSLWVTKGEEAEPIVTNEKRYIDRDSLPRR